MNRANKAIGLVIMQNDMNSRLSLYASFSAYTMHWSLEYKSAVNVLFIVKIEKSNKLAKASFLA